MIATSYLRPLRVSLVFLPLVLWSVAVEAWAVDFSQYAPIHQGFTAFMGRIDVATSHAIAAPAFVLAVDRLWLFFAFLITIWTLFRYSFRGLDLEEVLAVVVLALMTRVLLTGYDTLTDGIWELGDSVGASIQGAMIGTSDRFFGPAFIVHLVQRITMPSFAAGIFSAIYGALVTLLIGVISMVLSVLTFMASIWGYWGFTLAKIIGMLFIPFLLYERLSFLFDGWLRFFLGWIVYSFVARINIVLVVVALASYYRIPVPIGAGGIPTVATPKIASIFELIGLFTFAVVGIIALASTGRFAATVLSGAAGGGIGLAASQFARNVSRFAVRGR